MYCPKCHLKMRRMRFVEFVEYRCRACKLLKFVDTPHWIVGFFLAW